MMPVGDGEIVEVVGVRIHAPCRDLVQQRLPQVRCVLVDQRDVRALAATQALAQAGGQRQSAGTAPDNYETMFCRWRLGPGRPAPASARPTRRSVSTCDLSAKS